MPDDIDETTADRAEHDGGDDADREVRSEAPPIAADRAVIDRVVDGVTAVLLVGAEERPLDLPVSTLPEGATDGTWLHLDLTTDPPTVLGIDRQLTEQRSEDLEGRLRDLRRSRSGGRFD